MFVTQRVRNSAAEAVDRFVGFCPGMPKKSRVWSSAMMIMITPRTTSTGSRRVRFAGGVSLMRGTAARRLGPGSVSPRRHSTKHPGDCGDGVPVPRRRRQLEHAFDHAEVADDFRIPAVDAEHEPVVPRNHLE